MWCTIPVRGSLGGLLLGALAWSVPGLAAETERSEPADLNGGQNPYYLSVLKRLENVAAKPSLREEFDSCWEFRGLAERALNAAWAAGSDQSPRHGDHTLI